MSNSFFDEYLAPGLAIGGIGISAFRTSLDVARRGTVKAAWNAQKQQQEFISMVAAQRAGTYVHPSSYIAGALGHSMYAPLFAAEEFEHVFSQKLTDLSSSGLAATMDADPRHRQFFEEFANRYGLIDYENIRRLNLDQYDPETSHLWKKQQQLKKRIDDNELILEQMRKTKTVGAMAENGGLEVLSRESLIQHRPIGNGSIGRDRIARLAELSGSSTYGATLEAANKRIEQLGLEFQIKALKSPTGPKGTAIQLEIIRRRKKGNDVLLAIEIPDAKGIVRSGKYGETEGVARRVFHPELSAFLANANNNRALTQQEIWNGMTMRVDEFALHNIAEGYLDNVLNGKAGGREVQRALWGRLDDELGRPIIHAATNPLLNARIAQEVVPLRVGTAPEMSQATLDLARSRIVSSGFDPVSGPNQHVKNVSNLPGPDGLSPGDPIFGENPDPKVRAQSVKSTLAMQERTEVRQSNALGKTMAHTTTRVDGYRGPSNAITLEGRETTPRITALGIEEAEANAVFRSTGNAYINLSEDEAVLFQQEGSRIFRADNRKIELHTKAHLSPKTQELLSLLTGKHDNSQFIRPEDIEALKSGTGDFFPHIWDNTINGVPATGDEIARAATLRNALTFKGGETIGQTPTGGLETIPEGHNFQVTRAHYNPETGSIIMHGEEIAPVEKGFKTFGADFKRVFKEVFDSKDIVKRLVVAKDMSGYEDVLEAARKGDSDWLEAFYGKASGMTPTLEQTRDIARIQAVDMGTKNIGSKAMPSALQNMYEYMAEETDVRRNSTGLLDGPWKERRQEMLGALESSGISFDQDAGRWTANAGPRKNMAVAFDEAIALTVKKKGRGMWSASRLMRDLQASPASATIFSPDEMAGISQFARGGNEDAAADFYQQIHGTLSGNQARRELVINTLENQLKYGIGNRDLVLGIPESFTGAGREATFNLQMHGHARTQGGVMGDFGNELLGRVRRDASPEAQDLFRMLAIHEKGATTPAIKLTDLATSDIDRRIVSNIYSGDAATRKQAATDLKAAFNIPTESPLVFDLGEGIEKGRHLYHPEEVHRLSGTYKTAGGDEILNTMDKASKRITDLYTGGGLTNQALKEAQAGYRESLTQVAIKKDSPILEMFSGKVRGSLRGLAVSAPNDTLLKGVQDFAQENYRYSVGVSESRYAGMLAEAGVSSEESVKRLASLRAGEEAVGIARFPMADLHRFTSAKAVSTTAVLSDYAAHLTKGKTSEEIQKLFDGMDTATSRRYKKYLHDSDNAKDVVSEADRAHRGRQMAGDLFVGKYKDSAIHTPKWLESALGADYDQDSLEMFLSKDEGIRTRLNERASAKTDLLKGWDAHKATGPVGINDIDAHIAITDLSKYSEEARQGASLDFSYHAVWDDLYKNLKLKDKGVLSSADLTPLTDAWKTRIGAKASLAQVEKGSIGQLSNAVDFARNAIRGQSGVVSGKSQIMSEILLGLLPESALKIRQHGTAGVEQAETHLQELQKVLSGDQQLYGRTDREVAGHFRTHFEGLMGLDKTATSPVRDITNQLLTDENVGTIVGSVQHRLRHGKENDLMRALKNMDPSESSMGELVNMLLDPTIPSPYGAAARNATEGIVAEQMSSTTRHIKNAATTFEDVKSLFMKNKKPMLIGTGLAIATSMLLGSTGNISAEEANQAGARHQPGEPTVPATDLGNSAPVSTGSGRAVRIRGNSPGANTSDISNGLQRKFPGAEINVNVSDYRERINEQYLRRRLERG